MMISHFEMTLSGSFLYLSFLILQSNVRLLVNLTQPVCLCFPDTLSTKDIAASKCVIEVSQYLRQYKEVSSI